MEDIQNIPYLRVFSVKFISATNTKGSRVKIIDLHRSRDKEIISKTIPFNHKYNNIWEIATEYLNKLGIKILYRCGDKDKDYLLTKDFETDLK